MTAKHPSIQFKCDKCPQKYPFKSTLKNHFKIVHTNRQTFKPRWVWTLTGQASVRLRCRRTLIPRFLPLRPLPPRPLLPPRLLPPALLPLRLLLIWLLPRRLQPPRLLCLRRLIKLLWSGSPDYIAFQDKCSKRQTCVYKHMDDERDFVQNLLRGMQN